MKRLLLFILLGLSVANAQQLTRYQAKATAPSGACDYRLNLLSLNTVTPGGLYFCGPDALYHSAAQQNIAASPVSLPVPTIASPPVAGNIDNGVHSYAFSYVTAAGETFDSSVSDGPSAVLTIVDKTINGKANVVIPAAVDARVISCNLYRSKAATTTPFFLVANTTCGSTYLDNKADSSLTSSPVILNTAGGWLEWAGNASLGGPYRAMTVDDFGDVGINLAGSTAAYMLVGLDGDDASPGLLIERTANHSILFATQDAANGIVNVFQMFNSGTGLYIYGIAQAKSYSTQDNCSSAASPAACVSASAGSVVIAATATTVVVNTSAVTANSQIFLTEDSSLGSKLSVTCNTQSSLVLGTPRVTARTASTSFTISVDVGPTANPMCISYHIVN